jgi:group I intron endonuclease
VNGKYYIGQDSKNDPNYLGSGKLLKYAIEKYGIENFQKEILETCNTKEQLNEREIFWISKLDAIETGYNIARGGGGGDTLTNHPEYEKIIAILKTRPKQKWTKERKLAISGDKNPAKRPDVRKKISENRTGKTTGLFGDKNSAKRPEVRKKISEKLSGKPKPKIKCPHCDVEGQPANMYRWHFDKCKKTID